MKKLSSLIKNSVRALGMSFSFAKWLTFSLIVVTLASNLFPVWQAKVLGDIVNKVIEILKIDGGVSTTLASIVGLYALIWGLSRINSALRVFVDKRWTTYAQDGLEITAMKKRAEIDLGHYENPEFQNLLQRAFNRSIWPIFELIELQIQSIGNFATFLLTSVIATQLSPKIYFIVIITSIPAFVVNLKYGSKMWTIWAEHSPRQRLFAHLKGHITHRVGVTQTKLLQSAARLITEAKKVLDDFRNDQLKVDSRNLLWSILASLIAAVGMGVSFFLLASDVATGLISVGSLVFLVTILGQLVQSINQLLADLARQFERNLYVDDIFKVLDTKPYVKRAKKPVKLNLETAPSIEFRDVWFKYEGREDWILREVNMVIKPGEKIALVGENGAGKSTLVKLISRIYDPTKGEILINGVNLRKIDLEEWSAHLAVLLQDYMSYDFVVSDSIAMGRPEKPVDKIRVEEAARLMGAHEFITGWDKAYDQQLGKEFDQGIEPSKGQNQKLALTRVIYRAGQVVILDEPTAAIDAVAEANIFEKMEEAVGDNTLIVITHRFNTTQGVDRIIVLENGTIVETGNHKELLENDGLYAKMFEVQAKAFREADGVA